MRFLQSPTQPHCRVQQAEARAAAVDAMVAVAKPQGQGFRAEGFRVSALQVFGCGLGLSGFRV